MVSSLFLSSLKMSVSTMGIHFGMSKMKTDNIVNAWPKTVNTKVSDNDDPFILFTNAYP